jgi:cyclic pyranopterin phosphate synthase
VTALLPLVDRFGRVARDLRLSLTDRCNLRCTYCMPAEGVAWLPRSSLLDTAELLRLVRIGVERLGITHVRLTGGEPLLRPDLEELVAGIAALTPRPLIALTTNAIGLAARAVPLRASGLDRVNVSLDTLRRDRFATLARRDRLPDVLAGIDAAVAAGLAPVKVNAVLLPGVNDDETCDLLHWALAHGVQLRFIEAMPLDGGHGWTRERMLTADAILAGLSEQFEVVPDDADRGSEPAQRFAVRARSAPVDGVARAVGTVGVIGSVTRPFCADCDRTRITADGQLRSCLFSHGETDLRALLRGGADDAAVGDAWAMTMWAKAAGHGIGEPGFVQPDRPMSAIGG